MITDRISLNLIWIYLDQFQSNQGPIDSIQVSVKPHVPGPTKTLPTFQNLNTFKEFIDTNAPLDNLENMECKPLNLYELKSFNVTKDLTGSVTNKNYVINNNRLFQTDSGNINKANMYILNKGYIPNFKEVLKAFEGLELDEYILIQYTYIDCGYIQVYFNDVLDKVKELYKKYKKR
jgi:hypothetical protein